MLIMMIILENEACLKKLVSLMLEFELYQSSVLDGESIENIAMENVPVFTGIRSIFGSNYVYHKVIVSLVPDQETYHHFLSICTREGIDFGAEGTGAIFAIPCLHHLGNQD